MQLCPDAQRSAEAYMRKKLKPSVVFQKRTETSHVDCGRILTGDIAYTTLIAANRPVLLKSQMNSSCEEIRQRVMPPIPMDKLAFGVAYVRVVYRDYTLIEEELRSSYHPQNFFCYSIDQKADKDFHDRIKQLAVCFPNVLITPGGLKLIVWADSLLLALSSILIAFSDSFLNQFRKK
ncbi:Core-2/I-Branching enzyme [Cooperia oncophora]